MIAETNDYYDIECDIESILVSNGDIESLFYLKDLKQRKLFINYDIDPASIEEIIKHILQFNREDRDLIPEDRAPIILYITSNGGDVDAGFELIDVIRYSATPVYTVNLGFQYSMGFLIGLAGHKRFATENAKFLMHDGYNFVSNSGAKAQDQMEFERKVKGRIKKYILERSRLTESEYDAKLRIEWYMFADEAKEKGFTDYIIGTDCGLDAVI